MESTLAMVLISVFLRAAITFVAIFIGVLLANAYKRYVMSRRAACRRRHYNLRPVRPVSRRF